jgi:hypothetical protein
MLSLIRTSLIGISCGFPSSIVSFHSHMTTATVGSAMPLFLSPFFLNFTNMKGSTFPPHDFLLYMPEHFWLSIWFCDRSAMETYRACSLHTSVTSIALTAVVAVNSSSARLRAHDFMLPRELRTACGADGGGFVALRTERRRWIGLGVVYSFSVPIELSCESLVCVVDVRLAQLARPRRQGSLRNGH